MHVTYRFYIGARQIRGDELEAFDCVLETYLAGWSMFRAKGAWKDVDNGFVYEDALVYETIVDEPPPDIIQDTCGDNGGYIETIAYAAKEIFRQDAILVTATPTIDHLF